MTRVCIAGTAMLLVCALSAADLDGQAGPARSPQSYTSTTTAILVDVIVRDNLGATGGCL